MAKKGNLAAFATKASAPTPETNGTPKVRRVRGEGDVVQTSIRMTREDWKRLHVLALDMNTSLHSLFHDGVSMLLESKGLPRLEAPGKWTE
jgi:hypothetical protein